LPRRNGRHGPACDDVALREIELYAEVLTAVALADGPLTKEELDAALGVRRSRKKDTSEEGTRSSREDGGELIRVYIREVRDVPRLAPEDEINLITVTQGSGFPDEVANENLISARLNDDSGEIRSHTLAKQRVIEANLALVIAVAKNYQERGLTFLDLVQEGNLALVHAVDSFDTSKGESFSTYAVYQVNRAIENKTKSISLRSSRESVDLSELIEDIVASMPIGIISLIELQHRLSFYGSTPSARERTLLQLYYGLYDGYRRTAAETIEALDGAQDYTDLTALIPQILRSLHIPKAIERELIHLEPSKSTPVHQQSSASPAAGNHGSETDQATPPRSRPGTSSGLVRLVQRSVRLALGWAMPSPALVVVNVSHEVLEKKAMWFLEDEINHAYSELGPPPGLDESSPMGTD
jgi:RNA polymerase sigma factor (sigma-70 family)